MVLHHSIYNRLYLAVIGLKLTLLTLLYDQHQRMLGGKEGAVNESMTSAGLVSGAPATNLFHKREMGNEETIDPGLTWRNPAASRVAHLHEGAPAHCWAWE